MSGRRFPKLLLNERKATQNIPKRIHKTNSKNYWCNSYNPWIIFQTFVHPNRGFILQLGKMNSLLGIFVWLFTLFANRQICSFSYNKLMSLQTPAKQTDSCPCPFQWLFPYVLSIFCCYSTCKQCTCVACKNSTFSEHGDANNFWYWKIKISHCWSNKLLF